MLKIEKSKLAIFIAIFIATFMTSVEVTIVSTAMPTIISELHGLDIQSWVFVIYLLSTAITTPIYGKLSDNMGRKKIFMFGLFTFILGSFLCGFAPNMISLIAFRLLQGIGAGAVMPLTFTIIADLFTYEERANVMAFTNTAWAISALTGPLIGGTIVDTLGWHWIFFINVPLGLITIGLTAFGYKDLHQKSAKKPMDWGGIITLSIALVSLLLIFQEMASTPMNWLLEASLLIIFIISLTVFLKTEGKVQDPIINFEMFETRTFKVQILIALLLSGVLISFNIYFPIWLQSIYRVPAIIAGLALTPSSVMWMIASFFVGFLMKKFVSKHLFAVIVGILIVIYIPLIVAGETFSMAAFYLIAAISGAGMGIVLTATTLLAQKLVPHEMVGQASSMVVLARSIGQSMMTGIFGLVFTLGINAGLKKFPQISFAKVNEFISTTSSNEIAENLRASLNDIILSAVHHVFLLTILLCILTFVVNLLDKTPVNRIRNDVSLK